MENLHIFCSFYFSVFFSITKKTFSKLCPPFGLCFSFHPPTKCFHSPSISSFSLSFFSRPKTENLRSIDHNQGLIRRPVYVIWSFSFLKMMVVDGGVNPRKSSAAIREMGTSPLSTWSLCLDSFFLLFQKKKHLTKYFEYHYIFHLYYSPLSIWSLCPDIIFLIFPEKKLLLDILNII